MNVDDKTYREKVYRIVREIPPARVMTYGQIAEILGEGYTARTVGYVMHAAETESVPWQRVINSQGGCSTGKILLPYNILRVKPDGEYRVSMKPGITFRPCLCSYNKRSFPGLADDNVCLLQPAHQKTFKPFIKVWNGLNKIVQLIIGSGSILQVIQMIFL